MKNFIAVRDADGTETTLPCDDEREIAAAKNFLREADIPSAPVWEGTERCALKTNLVLAPETEGECLERVATMRHQKGPSGMVGSTGPLSAAELRAQKKAKALSDRKWREERTGAFRQIAEAREAMADGERAKWWAGRLAEGISTLLRQEAEKEAQAGSSPADVPWLAEALALAAKLTAH